MELELAQNETVEDLQFKNLKIIQNNAWHIMRVMIES